MLRIEARHLHSWRSLFRTCRASLSILIIAAVGIVLPPQTGDELAALTTMQVGPVPGLFILQFALGFLAVSAWYWARAALSARFGVDDTLEARASLTRANREAFDAVPRMMYLVGVLLSIFLVFRSPSWTHALSVASWAVPAYLLIRWRLAVTRPRTREAKIHLSELYSRRGFLRWARTIWPRFRVLVLLAPFSPYLAGVLLLLGGIGFIWGCLDGFVKWGESYPGLAAIAAGVFPGPSVAMIGLALIIGPLTAVIFILDGLRFETQFLGRAIGFTRPPVIMAILAWMLVSPLFFSLHTVRTLPEQHRVLTVTARKPLDEFFEAWVKACVSDPSKPARPIVVAISGGASRAGIWGAQVLAAVDAAAGQDNAAVFAISSVSGGSLGAGAYMAVKKATGGRCTRAPGEPPTVATMLDKLTNEHLGGDALGPLLAGALLSDTPRSLFSPFAALIRLAAGSQPRGGDRAEALERAFERLWRIDIQRAGLAHAGLPLFGDSFLSLFYDHGEIRPGMPLWITNGTDMTTGNRMMTLPFGSEISMPWPFRTAVDVLALLGADVPISTAINNSARFPFLEPSGEVISVTDRAAQIRRGRPDLLDGGYFDNEGIVTAAEIAEWLRDKTVNGQPVRPIIVQATANADISVAVQDEVVRCPDRPVDIPSDLPHTPDTLQVVAPVLGLYNARAAHAALQLRVVRDIYCRQKLPSFFHFYLFSSPDLDIPLNWLLSPETVAAIRSQLEPGHDNGNGAELACLRRVLTSEACEAQQAAPAHPPGRSSFAATGAK